jgi:hypothetical protein
MKQMYIRTEAKAPWGSIFCPDGAMPGNVIRVIDV